MRKPFIVGCLIFVFAILEIGVLAQSNLDRLEFPAEMNADIYHVIPLGLKGALFFYQTKEFTSETEKTWNIVLYDTDLKELWRIGLPVVVGALYMDYYINESTLYLLFLNPDKAKTGVENLQISALDLRSDTFRNVRGNVPTETQGVNFTVSGQNGVVGLNLKGDQAELFFINLMTGKIGSYLIETQDQNLIEDIAVDSSGIFDVIITNYISRKQNAMYLMSFDTAGNLVNHLEVQHLLENKYLNTAKVVALEPGVRLVMGTYRNFQGKIPVTDEYYGIESAGFFITKFAGDQQQYMNYYNFIEFQNLNKGIASKDYYKLQRKKMKENQEMSLDYSLVMHNIRRQGDQFVVLAEAYYPDYRTVSDVSYDYWGRPITQTYTVFEGYRYFNAIMAGFTADGELVWDNNFDLADVSTYNLDKFTDYVFDQNLLIAYYDQGEKIVCKVIDGSREVEGQLQSEIETSEAGDKVIETEPGMLKHWYDQFFICYGYQVIRNNLKTDNNRRTVFYFNKIALE